MQHKKLELTLIVGDVDPMRTQRIGETLKAAFPDLLHMDIVDESHMHAGRKGQESHFKILVVAPSFKNSSRVQRQRQVQELLKDEFELGLHALSLRLLTPAEAPPEIQSPFQSPNCAGSKDK